MFVLRDIAFRKSDCKSALDVRNIISILILIIHEAVQYLFSLLLLGYFDYIVYWSYNITSYYLGSYKGLNSI